MDNDGKFRKFRHRKNSRQPCEANYMKNSRKGESKIKPGTLDLRIECYDH